MPHGGYHGTVKIGGNVVQSGYQKPDGSYGISGGIDDESRLDFNPPSGSSGSGSSSPPMGSGPHSDGILSVKPTEGELAKEILFGLDKPEPKPLDADSIKEGYIAGLNTFIPQPNVTTMLGKPAISVGNPEFVPLAYNDPYFYSDKNYGKFAADAFTEGIASQLYNLYGDPGKDYSGGRYNQFQRKGDFGVENLIELDPMLPFKPKPSQGFELFGKNISLPEMPLFGKPIKELSQSDLEKILDEVKKYKDGLPNYFEGFPGGLNIAKGMLDSISQGEEREDGSPTLQGLTKFIREIDPDSNMLDAFKQADPETYLDVFGLPQTSAGLDFFANMGLTGDKTTDAKIIEARERLAQDKESQGQGGQGITSIPLPEATVITPTTPKTTYEQLLQQYGKPNLIPPELLALVNQPVQAVETSIGIPAGIPAIADYASMAPQFQGSQYTNLGVSPAFLENLRRFYG